MVVDLWGLLAVERLRVHDVLELVHSLRGEVHVSRQVAVEETQHVAVEGQARRHAAFVALGDER